MSPRDQNRAANSQAGESPSPLADRTRIRELVRTILILDLAVEQGVVTLETASEALTAWWARPIEDRGDLTDYLALCGDLYPGRLLSLTEQVDDLLKSSGPSSNSPDPFGGVSTAPPSIAPPGAAERFQELEPIGSGGMGIVYRAYDPALERWVALKFLRVDAGRGTSLTRTSSPLEIDPGPDSAARRPRLRDAVRRFQREAQLTGAIEHPGVPPIHEIGLTQHGVPYYAMRLLPGDRTLADEILPPDVEQLDQRLAQLEILLRICDTMEYAHGRGILHCDLKPQNIGLGDHGEVLLLDWGLAGRTIAADRPTAQDAGLEGAGADSQRVAGWGTAGYMAPEVAFGDPDAPDPRSDVFGLGVILFEILTGHRPFPAASLDDYRSALRAADTTQGVTLGSAVPDELAEICRATLRIDPASRYSSVGQLASDIRAWTTRRSREAEVRGWLQEARGSLRAAEAARGQGRMLPIDRAQAALEKALAKDPGRGDARRLRLEAHKLRKTALREEGQLARKRLAFRAGTVLLVILAAAAGVVAKVLGDSRNEAVRALGRAETEAQRAEDAAVQAKDALDLAETETRRAKDAQAEAERATRFFERAMLQTISTADGGRARALAQTPATAGEALSLALGAVNIIQSRFGVEPSPVAIGGLSESVRAVHQSLLLHQGHNNSVRHAAISFDARIVVTAALDGQVRVFETADGYARVLPGCHENGGTYVAISSDGTRVVSVGHDAKGYVYDATKGTRLCELVGHEGTVWCAAFSPDGAQVVTAGDDGRVGVWNALSGECVAWLTGHTKRVPYVTYTPDGAHIASVSHDGTIRIWSTSSGDAKHVLSAPQSTFGHIAFSPDGECLVASGGRTLHRGGERGEPIAPPSGGNVPAVWSMKDGLRVCLLSGHEGHVSSAHFDPQGRLVVTASDDGSVRVWTIPQGECLHVLRGHDYMVARAVFTPDGTKIMSGDLDGVGIVWRTEDGGLLRRLIGHEQSLTWVDVSKDGSAFLTACFGGRTRVWRDSDPHLVAELVGHEGPVTSVCFAPGGLRLATAGTGGKVQVWDGGDGEKLVEIDAHPGRICHVAWSPDGRCLATCSTDSTAAIWDSRSGSLLQRLEGHRQEVSHVAFSANGKRVITSSWDQTARIWNSETGQQVAVLDGPDGVIHWAEFSPDGARIAMASADATVHLWDAESGELVTSGELDESYAEPAVDANYRGVRRIGFSPTSSVFATFGRSEDALIIDSSAGDLVWRFPPGQHSEGLAEFKEIRSSGWTINAGFSPDGTKFVLTQSSGFASVWEVETGKFLRLYRGHGPRESIFDACFLPGGERVATAASDGSVHVWDIDIGVSLYRLTGHTGDVTRVVVSSAGTRLATASQDGTARIYDIGLEGLVKRAIAYLSFLPEGAIFEVDDEDSSSGEEAR